MKIITLFILLLLSPKSFADIFSFIDFSNTPSFSSLRSGILAPSPYTQQSTNRLIHQINASGLIGWGFLSVGGTFRIISGTETVQSEIGSQSYNDRTALSGLAYGLQAHIHLHYYLDVFGIYYLSYFENAVYTFSDVAGSTEVMTKYINPLELGLSFNLPILSRVTLSARIKYVYMPYGNQTRTNSSGSSVELYKFSQVTPVTPRQESLQAGIALRFYL